MNVRDIVQRAWQLTQENLRRLIWYGFTPAFFGVVVSSAYLGYQYYAFRHSNLFSADQEAPDFLETFRSLWGLVSDHLTVAIILLVLAIVFFLCNMLLKPIFMGGLIAAVNRVKNGQVIQGSAERGVRKFFPLFEFGLLTGAFSITTLFTESSFILRTWGEQGFFVALPILLFIAMAGLVINFLFTYTEYYIVLRDQKLIKAIMESTVLVVANLRKTFLVFILMLLIGARIILNVLLVLLIPMFVVFLATYFATLLISTLGMVLVAIVSLVILVISAYLLGLFQIFASAVWVLTFDELTSYSEDPPAEPLQEAMPESLSEPETTFEGPLDDDSHLPPAAGMGL